MARCCCVFYLQCTLKHGISKFCFSWYVQENRDADDSYSHVDFAGGNVQLITTKESWEQKLSEASRDGQIVLANFSATWCGPCRMIAPFYNELSEKYLSLMFLLIDVDELTVSSWVIFSG
uniref:Thioredoxin H-type-like n=1 Tax=Rhizophora mucronata TaxID=61149 RepID=A0A2P2LZK7_RHIMU